jgi:FixJ family two-component response regulator
MSTAEKTVLVVDDEPQVRELACRALKRVGFQCEQASDGEQGFRMASGKKYDAVVTDLRMPQRHGHAFCSDLLNLPAPPPVMVLTGLADARIVRDLMGRGVHDIVSKPVHYDMLAMKVVMMVETAQRKQTRPTAKPRPKMANKINLLHQIETTLAELTDLYGDKLDSVFDWHEELADPPKAIRDCIRRLAENEVSDGERGYSSLQADDERKEDRVTCYTSVIAAPVDRDWKPKCEPFKLALRDLSEQGIRLLHTRAPNAEYLALQWNATQLVAKQLRVVAKVTRVKPLSPFYDIGGQFVMAD